MSLRKKILIGIPSFFLVLVILFIIFVGPWPTYAASNFESKSYYKKAIAAMDENIRESNFSPSPARLSAGWAAKSIVPTIGTPLAGYGARNGKPSTGVHDEIYVKALALSDGSDTAVLIGSDMLLVPNNVADLVRVKVVQETPLNANDLLFNASHTHDAPGAWAPGFAGNMTGGAYDPKIVTFLADAFSEAIIAAYKAMEPASYAVGNVDAPEYIRNREREASVDPELNFMVFKQDDGDQCCLVSYNAHPTVLGSSNMEFSADYPGYLQRYVEKQEKTFSVYLGGAVGSMGPKPPEAEDMFARAQAMGEALGKLVLDNAQNLTFKQNAEIASVGVPITIPPIQFRVINTSWRLSPFIVPYLGVDRGAWMHGVRVDQSVFVGFPCDFSGEISLTLKAWAKEKNLDLWNLSFCADYVGYISPDKYYMEMYEEGGDLAYETGLMSWCGPDQEAFFTALAQHLIQVLTPS